MKEPVEKMNRNGSRTVATQSERPELGFANESNGAEKTELETVENYVPRTDFDTVTMSQKKEN